MRTVLVFVTLLLLLLGACRSNDAVGPPSLLYHRWQLVQIQEADKVPQYPTTAIFIAFAPNGTIQYDQAGNDGACCVPRRFSRTNQTLILDYSADQPEYCKYVDLLCSSVYASGPQWIVARADDQELWLQMGNKWLIHKRAD